MQFRVPQNIAMEDRIIGSLTAIQFGIIVIGGGIAFYIYTTASIPKPINQIAAGLMALLTVVLGVGKFNDQPMYRFFKFVISFMITPRTRIWHKKSGPETVLISHNEKKQNANTHPVTKHIQKADIERLAVILDSRGKSGGVPLKSKV